MPGWGSGRRRAWSRRSLGTREHDPWSPDALVWPLLGVVDAHAGEAWCRVLSQHLGHGEAGEEGELRRGRRYAVARRLAQLFASYAVQRPLLLSDWESGDDSDGAGGALDPDLAWQPELWRLLVAQVDAPSPRERHLAVLAALRERPQEIDLPARFSLFGHTRIPATEVELLGALGEHRDVHLWLPHPSPALWDALDRPRPARCRAARTPRTSGSATRCSPRSAATCASCSAPLPSVVEDGRAPATVSTPPTSHAARLAAAGHRRQRDRRPGHPRPRPRRPQRAGARLPRPVAPGRGAARGGARPALRRPDARAARHPGDVPGHRVLRAADRGGVRDGSGRGRRPPGPAAPGAAGRPGAHADQPAARRGRHAARPRRRTGRGERGARPGRQRSGAAPVRAHRDDLETITGWVEQAGVRWAFDADHRAPYGLEGFVQNTWQFGLDRVLAGVAMSDDAERWIGTTLPLDDVGSHHHRPGRSARRAARPAPARHRPADRQPPRGRLARRPPRRHRRAHLGRARRRVADRAGAARALGARGRRQPARPGARAAAARRTRADVRAPRRPAHPRQLPHRHADRLHDGADALGAAPRGLPARSRRRRLPARVGGRRRRRARPPAADR